MDIRVKLNSYGATLRQSNSANLSLNRLAFRSSRIFSIGKPPRQRSWPVGRSGRYSTPQTPQFPWFSRQQHRVKLPWVLRYGIPRSPVQGLCSVQEEEDSCKDPEFTETPLIMLSFWWYGTNVICTVWPDSHGLFSMSQG